MFNPIRKAFFYRQVKKERVLNLAGDCGQDLNQVIFEVW